MVKMEILRRCSRMISAFSDTGHLPGWALRCAPCSLIAASLHHDFQFASHDGELNDDSHFTRLCRAACRPEAGLAGFYFRKCVRCQRTSLSAPGPACGFT